MRRRAAHVETVDRRLVLRPSWSRTQEEQLLQCQLALEDIAFRQSPLALEIQRRHHLTMQDGVAHVGRVLGKGVDDDVAEGLALGVPRAVDQMIRSVLHEAGHHVLARWRDTGSVSDGITMSMYGRRE